MRAERGYITGQLAITDHNYISSNTAIHAFDYTVANGITVGHFIGLITQNQRQNYNMSGGGSGCRWWIWTVVSDFAQQNYLRDGTGTTSDLWPRIHNMYFRDRPATHLGMVRGDFVPQDGESDESDE
eukprot:GHVU01125705.1.p1 GENE.GHVU01125705.1~~GHVU01125705.1.p1  ORF type:complete len:148 (+),score=17.65 GHVU01125705.1:64-444(+)